MSDNMETGRTGKDCVIVALANYMRRSYDDVLKDCYANISTNAAKENHVKNGFYAATYIAVLEKHLGRKLIFTKRTNAVTTGIIRFARPSRKSGHLVFALLGIVYDVDGTETPIAEYRQKYGYNCKGVWLWDLFLGCHLEVTKEAWNCDRLYLVSRD